MSDDNDEGKSPDIESAVHEREELMRKLNKWVDECTHLSNWRVEARKWFDMTAGEQWSANDKSKMLEEMRAPITFNRIDPMISAVCGAEILNRQSVQYYPREIGDSQVSEMLGAAADWVRDNCDAEDEESDAFTDLVICGMGWTDTALSYDDVAEGDILIARVDPLEMGWDPSARKRNLADARFIFREREYDKDDFKSKFPGKLDEVVGMRDSSPEDSSGAHRTTIRDQYTAGDGTGNQPANRDKIRVVQMQWWDLEPAFAVQNPQSGQVQDLQPEQMKGMVQAHLQAGMMPPQVVKGMRRVFKQAIFTGNVLCEDVKDLPGNAFTLQCMTGKRDRNKNTWYGIVKAMVDPQMWANKWLSQLLHIINSNAKGGVLFETGSFPNFNKARDEWARPDGMVEVSPGSLSANRIQPRTPAALPPGLQYLMEFSVESLPQVSGINLEMLGLVQREQAGVLEAQRKKSGYAILAVFFDALRRYRKMQGRVLLEYINKYISDGRLIRIKGEAGSVQYKPLMRMSGATKYDIVVDEAPMSQNQKEAVWGMLVQMLPILKEMPIAPDVIAKMIEYSPLPSSLSAQLSKSITEPRPPDPRQEKAAELQLAELAAKVQKLQSDAALSQAKASAEGMPGAPEQAPALEFEKTLAEIQQLAANTALLRAKTRSEMIEGTLKPTDRAITAHSAAQKRQQPAAA